MTTGNRESDRKDNFIKHSIWCTLNKFNFFIDLFYLLYLQKWLSLRNTQNKIRININPSESLNSFLFNFSSKINFIFNVRKARHIRTIHIVAVIVVIWKNIISGRTHEATPVFCSSLKPYNFQVFIPNWTKLWYVTKIYPTQW